MNTPDTTLIPERRSPFSANVPNFQFALDSTSLGLFKECAKKYYYQIILGYQPKGLNVHLKFGLLYHYAHEVFDHARAEGASHDDATLRMVRETLLAAGERDADGTFHPWQSADPYKNLWTLIRSVVWSVDHFQGSAFQTVTLANGKPAVELSFNFEAFEIHGEIILLCGHMDRLIEQQGGDGSVWVGDRKTTKNQLNDQFFKSFTPHNQFSLYSVASKVVLGRPTNGVMVDAAQVGVGFTRFAQRPAPRSQAVLDEWMHDTALIVDQMYRCAVSGHWPMNDKSCLAGDTVIKVTRGKMKGRKTTLKKFHSFFHGKTNKKYDHSIPSYALSDVGGYVAQQRIVDVVKQGIKPVFRLTTLSGKSIKATADHLFKTANGWARLDELSVGDKIMAWAPRELSIAKQPEQRQAIYSIPFHPNGHKSIVKGKDYKRLWRSRIVVEAAMNNLSEEEFIRVLREDANRAATLSYLPSDVEIHHKDGDCRNDTLSNLEVLSMEEHKSRHNIVQALNATQPLTIKSIEPAGEEMTYDLVMEAPHHNFIANDFVVHNCGNYGGCAFAKVCGVSPKFRKTWLEADFAKWEWNPLSVRGDI